MNIIDVLAIMPLSISFLAGKLWVLTFEFAIIVVNAKKTLKHALRFLKALLNFNE